MRVSASVVLALREAEWVCQTRAPTHWWGDVAGRCSDPLTVSWQATRTIEDGVVDLRVPCRKCKWCLIKRSREWAGRAITEQADAERTWMVTLTYRDSVLLPDEDGVVIDPRKELTLWLQRLKRTFGRIRYFVVTERGGRNGRLHHHALVHGSGDLTWRRLQKTWTNGHFKANLAYDEGAGRYIAKYITKEAGGRVRASRRYGRPEGNTALRVGSECNATVFSEATPRARGGTEGACLNGLVENGKPLTTPITALTIEDTWDVDAQSGTSSEYPRHIQTNVQTGQRCARRCIGCEAGACPFLKRGDGLGAPRFPALDDAIRRKGYH